MNKANDEEWSTYRWSASSRMREERNKRPTFSAGPLLARRKINSQFRYADRPTRPTLERTFTTLAPIPSNRHQGNENRPGQSTHAKLPPIKTQPQKEQFPRPNTSTGIPLPTRKLRSISSIGDRRKVSFGFEQNLQRKTNVLRFSYVPETDSDIIRFVKSQDFIKQLATKLQYLAKVNFRSSNDVIKFSPVSKEKLKLDCQNDQDKFKSECIQTTVEFFDQFSFQEHIFDLEKLNKLRKTYGWNANEEIINIKIDDNIYGVFVRWSNGPKENTKIAGLFNDVVCVMKWLDMKINYSIESEKYSEGDFEILAKFNIFEKISQKFSETLHLKTDENSLQVTFKGLSNDITKAKDEIIEQYQALGRCKLTSLEGDKLKFLQDLLQNVNNCDNMASTINSNLDEENIKAIVCTQPELELIYNQESDKKQAEILLDHLIQARKIQVGNGFKKTVCTPEWKNFQQNLNSKNIQVYTDIENSSLTVVGLSASIDTTYKEVKRFVSENLPEERIVNVSYPFALFLNKFFKELSTDVGLKGLQWKKTSKSGGGIRLRGKRSFVTKGETWLLETQKSMKSLTKFVKEPGMAKYFRNECSEQFLRMSQTTTKCIILVDTDNCSKWEYDDANASKNHSSQTTFSLPKVTVKLGDISNEKADVVVTSTLPQDFTSACGSATSKALFDKVGSALQDACLQAASNYSLEIGNVIETPGFNLPCKKIYHVILCQYDLTNSETYFRNGIQDCLKMSESDGFSRIAFPALGTGGMEYPTNLVALWFQQEINKFKATNLKNVDIVLLATDQTAIQDFYQVFQETVTTEVSVNVTEDNILDSNCDVIVNPVSSNYQLGGQLSIQLMKKAGQSVADECQSNPKYTSTSYRVTSGGNLNCQFIVHLVSPSDAQKISSLLEEVLTFVDQTLRLKSIAIPAIGTGNAGLKPCNVAHFMNTAIQNFQNSYPRFLRRIDVIVYDANMLSEFSLKITSSSQADAPLQAKPPSIKTSFIPVESSTDSADEIQLYLFSNKQANIDEACELITQHVEEKYLRKQVKHEVISELSEIEHKELRRLEEKHNVLLRISNNNSSSELVISGLKDDVMDAYTAATEILQEYKEALTCAEYVVWKYKDPRSGKFVDFPLKASFQIETAYKKDPKSSFTFSTIIHGLIHLLSIDLNSMTQENYRINSVTQIVRESKIPENLPPDWEDMGKDELKKVIVHPNTDEYKQIVSEFQSSDTFDDIAQLERIQNPILYKQFQAQKNKITSKMEKNGSKLPVMHKLFHGTDPDASDNIYKDGFDRSHAGKNATAYGKGVYFATTSQYSRNYATQDNQGLHRMFYADVITGEFCQGDSSYATPPSMPGFTTQRYDSVVDDVNNPSIFVVFKDASVYPSYMLTYK